MEQIREWNDEWQPKSLLDLFEGFLIRMPLHRLAHFLDMVLPQLSPMHTRWDDPRKTLLCCHFFRLARTDVYAQVRLQFLFTSRALIYMGFNVSILRAPLGNTISKWGFQKGILFSYIFPTMGCRTKLVLVSMSSAPSKSKRGEHAMWKHVLPVSTDFAWLPEDVAEAFCSLALRQDQTRPYGSFHEVATRLQCKITRLGYT